jgi:hypothetical protein
MQAKRRSDAPSAAEAIAVEQTPSRYWGVALIGACAASWALLLGAAKLLLALI